MNTRIAASHQPIASGIGPARRWYREPWPWILMAGPAVVVVAGVVTLWLAVRSNDGLVADDYYKQGVAINKTIARDERAQQLALQGELDLDSAGTTLRLKVREGVELPSKLRLVFSHATRNGLDRSLILEGKAGAWRGPRAELADGRWLVTVEDEAGTWRLVGNLHLPGAHRLVLGGGRE